MGAVQRNAIIANFHKILVDQTFMATYHHTDGDFKMTVITHGQPDPHIAAQAILPLVMAAIEKLQQEDNAQPNAKAAACFAFIHVRGLHYAHNKTINR